MKISHRPRPNHSCVILPALPMTTAAHSSTVSTSFANKGQMRLDAASLASCEKPAVQSDLVTSSGSTAT
jgi:hypothetical protein